MEHGKLLFGMAKVKEIIEGAPGKPFKIESETTIKHFHVVGKDKQNIYVDDGSGTSTPFPFKDEGKDLQPDSPITCVWMYDPKTTMDESLIHERLVELHNAKLVRINEKVKTSTEEEEKNKEDGVFRLVKNE